MKFDTPSDSFTATHTGFDLDWYHFYDKKIPSCIQFQQLSERLKELVRILGDKQILEICKKGEYVNLLGNDFKWVIVPRLAKHENTLYRDKIP